MVCDAQMGKLNTEGGWWDPACKDGPQEADEASGELASYKRESVGCICVISVLNTPLHCLPLHQALPRLRLPQM